MKILVVLLIFPPLLWLSIIVLNINLPLSVLNKPMSTAASYALGRNVHFGGEITLAPRLLPTFEITKVSIGNPEGQEGQLLQLGHVYLEIDLLSLLAQDIVVEKLYAHHVSLTLEVGEDDVGNWLLNLPAELTSDNEGDSEIDMGNSNDWSLSADIRQVAFEDIEVIYRDASRNTELLIELNRLQGSLRWRNGILLEGSGTYRQQPLQLTVRGGAVRDLMQGKPGWQANADAIIAGLGISWQLNLLQDGRETMLHLKGPNLATLSTVTEVELPDLGPYEISGVLNATKDSYVLRNFRIRIGESDMKGSLNLRVGDNIPQLKIELASTFLQLSDFLLGGVDDTVSVKPEDQDDELARGDDNSQLMDMEKLLSPRVLNNLDIDLSISFDEIFSGQDRLGGGRLRASTGGGRVVIEEWHINLVGGNIDVSGELMATDPGYQLTLKLDIENFDYGVIARRWSPESEMKGQFFLNVDLQSTTPHLHEAMAYGKGSLGFAVWPEQFKSGVIDLWAVGLISAVVNHYRSDSVVNCVVTRFDLEDGIMQERALMIDTSKIRVLGDALIDFTTRSFNVYLVPRAKKRQIVSAATPVRLKGSFNDFKSKVKRSDITDSVIRSGVNIALMGFPLLFKKTMRTDGSADCRRAMTKDFSLDQSRKSSVNHNRGPENER